MRISAKRLAIVLMCCSTMPVAAGGVADYELFSTFRGEFFGYSRGLRDQTSLFSLPTDYNHLATDIEGNRLLFVENFPSTTDVPLLSYSFDDESIQTVGMINNVSAQTAGGATFLNDSYWFYDDGGSGRLLKVRVGEVRFDTNGIASSISTITTGNDFELGDMAADVSNASILLLEFGTGNLHRLDTRASTPEFNFVGNLGLSSSSTNQMAFDSNGRLIVSTSVNRRLLVVDPTDATIVDTLDMPFSTFFADLSRGAANVDYRADFDGDGDFTCPDIDALTRAIASDSANPVFDLNGDGTLDLADRDYWLAAAGSAPDSPSGGSPFLVGDANLDGTVDVSDFNVWNSHKLSTGTAWCSGDFNADANTDVSDFNLWNGNRLTSSDISTVPEPGSLALCLLGLLHVLSISRPKTNRAALRSFRARLES